MPGTDPQEAARLVFGELTELPYLPELPARGAGAEMIGRSAALLVDLPTEVVPSGWRISARRGRDLRRAQDYLAWDLDALESAATGWSGPLKVQIAGPWTLAAGIELPTGHKVVSDRGATRDLAQSLTEGLAVHLDELRRRVPAATLIVQFDEPSLPAVLAGQVPTPSGYGSVSAIEPVEVESTLRTVLEAAPDGARVVHCCAADVPVAQLRNAGATGIGLDITRARTVSNDALGEAVDAGLTLWLGVLPAVDTGATAGTGITVDTAREPLRALWQELGFPMSLMAERVVATACCGLAGATPAYCRRVFSVLRDVGSWLRDEQ